MRNSPDAHVRLPISAPSFSDAEIEQPLQAVGARFTRIGDDDLIDRDGDGARRRARRWAGSRAAWSLGRARSATARSSATRARPTCRRCSTSRSNTANPSGRSHPPCCARTSTDWFELDCDSPYMLLVADVVEQRRRAMTRRRSRPVRHRQAQCRALRHSGGHPCRLFGAGADRAPGNQSALPWASQLSSGDGCPVLVNTSFNVRGEPIVCTPEDAFRCFMGTEIEMLVIGNFCCARKTRIRRSSSTTRTLSNSIDRHNSRDLGRRLLSPFFLVSPD